MEISAFDTESGVVPGSLKVTCNLRLGSFAPGANLATGKNLDPKGAVLRLVLPRRVRLDERAVFTVSVRDAAGHTAQVVRMFKGCGGWGEPFSGHPESTASSSHLC